LACVSSPSIIGPVKRPQTILQTAKGSLSVGEAPRIVGTFSSDPDSFPRNGNLAADVVELRVDQMPQGSDWLGCAKALQVRGIPVIVTIRMKAEGGNWTRPETERLPLIEEALDYVAAVDIEMKSKLAEQVGRAAQRNKKACIVSFHDFEKTPNRGSLEAIVERAQTLGSVVKISTKIRTNEDSRTLAGLLLGRWKRPLCVIGMGEAGSHTRVSFPLFGSCLAYAYLERPAAPGQLSAARLREIFQELIPDY